MLNNILRLSEKGGKNLIVGILLTALHHLCVILPTGVLLWLASDMIMGRLVQRGYVISLLLYWGLALILLIAIYWSYRFVYRKVFHCAYQESANTRIRLAEKIRRLPLSYFGKRDLSDLSSTLMDDTAIVEHALTSSVTELFGGIISSLVILFILFLFDWRMGLSLFICLPGSLFFLYLNLWLSPWANKKNRMAQLDVSQAIQEFLENIKVLYASPKKKSFRLNVEKTILRVVRTSMIYELVVGVFITAAYNVLKIGLGLVVVVGAWLAAKAEINLITFLLFIFVAAKVYDPFTLICFMFCEFVFSLLSGARISEIHDYPVQNGSPDITIDAFDICFDNVSFAYNTQKVIDGVSFVAEQGEITALVGPSGSGKTTLSKLACRFWDVKDGRILIGGKDINGIDPEILLGFFSIVFQDVVLFNDTIYNNIKIGKKDATKEEITAAAKMARCEDFIQNLPESYDTVIGENGKTLSGGERQRISIARAFLKDAPIILLDEATASLDPENEKLIQEAISRLIINKTVLIIAHRLPLIENCDKIVVLKQGKVVESGKHNELMAANDLYSHLFGLQQKSLKWKAVT